MSHRPLLLLLLLAALPAAAQVALPSNASRDSTRAAIDNLPVEATLPINKILRFSVSDDQLAAALSPDLPDRDENLRFAIQGADASVVLRRRNLGGGPYITLTRYDFDAPADDFWSVSLTLRSNYFSLYGQTGDGGTGLRVRLTQSGRTLRLYVTSAKVGAQTVVLSVAADSLRQLQADHPVDVRRYLATPLRRIAGFALFKPGPADVYRVFDQIPADPDVARKVAALVGDLAADAFTDRQRAARELRALGPAGILALLRYRQAHPPGPAEVANRLDAILAGASDVDLPDVRAARADGHFLLDCFDDPDPRVRRAAREALEAVVRRPVPFDLDADPGTRITAIDTLRKQLHPQLTTRPTTQPATQRSK